MKSWLLVNAPLLALGLSASFYLAAGVWTWFVAWPFMRDTRRAAVEGLAASNRLAALLAGVPVERLEAVLAALERLGARPAPRDPGAEALRVPLPPAPANPQRLSAPDVEPV